jgi:hypothetical protein
MMEWRWRETDARNPGDPATHSTLSPPGHVRGVDIFLVRGGKVAEKLAYVKG